MRILYLVKSFATKAGTERVMSDKMNWLSDKGHEITLVTYEQGNHSFAFRLNSSIRHYDLNTRFFTLTKYCIVKRVICYLLLKRKFKKEFQFVVDEIKPDIIVLTSYSLFLFDVVISIKTTSKRIIESHAVFDTIKKSIRFRSNKYVGFVANIYDMHFFSCVKKYDGVITLTKSDSEKWAKYSSKVFVIPNPVTAIPDTIANVERNHRIICVGRLHEEKGFDLLIESFAQIFEKCPGWNVVIYGDGSEKNKLEKQISDCGLKGRVSINPSTDSIYNEYLNSGLYVLCSRYEGFGLVLIEAMACGLPCISFDCPFGPREIIDNCKNGIIVENGNVRKMAYQMLWLINNTSRRVEMGKAARDSSFLYRKDNIMNRWLALFNTLI